MAISLSVRWLGAHPVNDVEWQVLLDRVVECELLAVHDDPQREMGRCGHPAVVDLARDGVHRLSKESTLDVQHALRAHLDNKRNENVVMVGSRQCEMIVSSQSVKRERKSVYL